MIIDPYTWNQFTIQEKQLVSVDTVAVRFRRPTSYLFRAGQYAVTRVTNSERQQLIRQYSFSSSPEDEVLELLIQREPHGAVSNWFFNEAKSGDTVELSQPLGNFTLEAARNRPALLIAGRVGVAPFISMIKDARGKKLSLLYSVRTNDQICYPELLTTQQTTIITTAQTPRIDKTMLAPLLLNKPVVYICGSKQFVDAISGFILESNVAEIDLRRELFTLQ